MNRRDNQGYGIKNMSCFACKPCLNFFETEQDLSKRPVLSENIQGVELSFKVDSSGRIIPNESAQKPSKFDDNTNYEIRNQNSISNFSEMSEIPQNADFYLDKKEPFFNELNFSEIFEDNTTTYDQKAIRSIGDYQIGKSQHNWQNKRRRLNSKPVTTNHISTGFMSRPF